MKIIATLGATAALIGIAAPAAAQGGYYPQPQQGYPQPGYQQGYPQQQGGIAGVINQLLGNRYQQNDRTAISQCAAAAQQQAAAQYRPRGNAYGYNQQGYNQQGYNQQGYNQQGYAQNGYGMARVTAISNVERTRNGLRVTGMMDSGMGYSSQGYNQGYNQGYPQQQVDQYGRPINAAAMSDLTFRCNVDYRGAVTNVRINRNRSVYNR